MAFRYSAPFEELLEARCGDSPPTPLTTARIVVVGSGYGGAVAAYRLAGLANKARGREYEVLVLERGREYRLGEFPKDLGDLPGFVQWARNKKVAPGPNDDALFDLRIGEGVDVLVGCGLGGTSLINANVALRPPAAAFAGAAWPDRIRTESTEEGSALHAAFAAVEQWLDVASPQERERLKSLPKYQALARYARALGFEVEPAPITVTLGDPGSKRPSAGGVLQPACTLCGNCVSGCNVGAKNTLTMNLIPAARRRGANFLTGVQVLRIESLSADSGWEPSQPRWRVRVRPIVRETRVRFDGSYAIDADVVVLAAGTLGSTEILQRSTAGNHLSCSPHLGSRFSTNGDAIAMSFAEKDPVQAIGHADESARDNTCGPTIAGVARGYTSKTLEPFTLEEGAVPASFSGLFGELVTTGAQFARLGNNRVPGWFRGPGKGADLLSVQPGALKSSQVFLVMADDGARGELQFADVAAPDLDDTLTMPVWQAQKGSTDPSPVLSNIVATLSRFDRRSGQNYGQFVNNPAWEVMPPSAAAAMSGRFPGGRLLTVHPLGGCPMADRGYDGVVDDTGQVFIGASNATHQGLYVLDGSIVPAALGVNPFLTIAALAWRACDVIVKRLGGEQSPEPNPQPEDPPSLPPSPPVPTPPRPPRPPRIIVTEQLVGRLEAEKSPQAAAEVRQLLLRSTSLSPGALDRCFEQDGLILRVRTEPFELAALERPCEPLCVQVELHLNPLSAEDAKKFRAYGVPRQDLSEKTLVASGAGSVTIMSPSYPRGLFDGIARARAALCAYLERRESLSDLWRTQRSRGAELQGSILKTIVTMWRIAWMHGTYRDFNYGLTLAPAAVSAGAAAAAPPRIQLRGTKRIAWRPGHERLWKAFTTLETEMTFPEDGQPPAPAPKAAVVFTVDMVNLVGDGLLQVEPGSPVPAGILGCLSFLLRMGRCALQAGFWEFGAPEYPLPADVPQPRPALPPCLNHTPLATYELRVPRSLPPPGGKQDGATIPILLHSYRGEGRREPVLLIHGLAQGSLIYAHTHLKSSMADYLLGTGYDVWLLDYRLSNQFTEKQIPYSGWSMDEIGFYDVPTAVKALLKHYPAGTRVHVFAHCVGAVATTMAILKGYLTRAQLASVVLNAIHPWVEASPANEVRAKLAVFFRDFVSDALYDPIIQSKDQVGAAQSLADRLAFSLARLGEGRLPGDGVHAEQDSASLANAICDRMTFLYGRMWKHQNVTMLHADWKDLVGRAPGAVARHLYYLLIRRRVVDDEGQNVYLLDDNVKHWQGIRTLFIHGNDSRVFNPQSATKSAVRLRAVLKFLAQDPPPAGQPAVPPTPVGLKRFPGYGHMDPILADDAAEVSYPYVKQFFAGHFDNGATYGGLALDPILDSDDPGLRAPTRLLTGPVLRAARLEGNDLILRMWLELPVDNTSPSTEVDFKSIPPKGVVPVRERPLGSVGKQYRWLDVTLPADQYKTVTASARPGGSGVSPRVTQEFHRQILKGLYSGKPASGALADALGLAHDPQGLADEPAWLRRLRDPDRSGCYFLVGSCRYPGTPFDRSGADQAFQGMWSLLNTGIDCDLLFLVGDQIYADATGGILDPTPWRDRYVDRYREAFGSEAFGSVLNALPCHFAIDDHEFVDNYAGYVTTRSFPHDPTDRQVEEFAVLGSGTMTQEQFDHAREVALAYMGSGRGGRPFGTSQTLAGRFWYALDDPAEISCPAFILDTRSERLRATATSPARLMSDEQMAALDDWLSRHNGRDGRPKFIFLGSPIIPLTREFGQPGFWMRQDGPTGYPAELAKIVSAIAGRGMQRVVLVAGDPHLSCVGPLRLTDCTAGRTVNALHIIASGLYSPLPFANLSPSAADWSTAVDWSARGAAPREIELPNARIGYQQELLIAGLPHFLRVSAEPEGSAWTIGVQAYGGDGQLLRERRFTL